MVSISKDSSISPSSIRPPLQSLPLFNPSPSSIPPPLQLLTLFNSSTSKSPHAIFYSSQNSAESRFSRLLAAMSGATLASGPRVQKHLDKETHGEKFDRRAGDSGGLGGIMGSLRVIELQLVAFIIVFSASGLVPVVDLMFPVFLSLYAFLLSSFVFPNYGNPESLQVFKGNRLFQVYVVLGTVIGLFLPLAYVLGGFARNDQESVRAATPHLFLLSFQVLSENLISGLNIFSVPVRALLPILYSMRRLFSLNGWVINTWFATKITDDIRIQDETWIWFGRALSAANAIYYTTNLFGFLIPMFLPRAFESYFEDRANFHKEHPKQEKSYGLPSLPAKLPVPSLLKKEDPHKEKKSS